MSTFAPGLEYVWIEKEQDAKRSVKSGGKDGDIGRGNKG